MTLSPVQAALAAVLTEAAALAVAYGLVDNAHAQTWIALGMAIVTAAGVIAHALHAGPAAAARATRAPATLAAMTTNTAASPVMVTTSNATTSTDELGPDDTSATPEQWRQAHYPGWSP